MWMRRFIVLWLLSLGCLAMAQQSLANEPGQEELDQAVDAKLSAESINELTSVIDHCQRALELGLEPDSVKFAERLLASTLLQRADAFSSILFRGGLNGEDAKGDQLARLRQAAIEDLNRSLEFVPEQAHAHYLLGRLYAVPGGDRPRSLKALARALELAGDDTELRAKVFSIRAIVETDPERRLADFNEAVSLAPTDPEILRARGLYLAEVGKMEEARADLQKAVELDPSNAGGYETLSALLTELKQFDEALAQLDKAIEVAPTSSVLFIERARIHLMKADLPAAVEDLDKSLELGPGNPMALLLRGNALAQLGKREQALSDIDALLEMKSDFAPARRLHGLLMADQGKLPEAIADLQKVVQVEPDDADARLQLAMLHLANKNAPAAIVTFNQAIKLKPDNWLAFQGRADAQLSIGKQSEALADYEEALKLHHENSTLLNNLAWLLATSPEEKLRDGARAVKLATEACELTDFKAAHILSTLAAAYAETGDFDKAREWSTKAVEAGDEGQKEALGKELESYRQNKPWRELQSADEVAESSDAEAEPKSDAPADEEGTPKERTAARDAASDKP